MLKYKLFHVEQIHQVMVSPMFSLKFVTIMELSMTLRILCQAHCNCFFIFKVNKQQNAKSKFNSMQFKSNKLK
jgi:hypothetical protein